MSRKANTKGCQLADDSVWTARMDRDAKLEGWALFNADGVVQIQKLDEPENVAVELGVKKLAHKFKSDGDAYEFVIGEARWTSKLHALALYLDGRHTGDDLYVPQQLSGEKGKWVKVH